MSQSTKIFWNGGFMMKYVEEAVTNACRECAEDLLSESRKLVPVDTGYLKEHSEVVENVTSGKVEMSVVYTDYDVKHDYDNAVRQHEDLWQNHPNGGQAKYLQEPFEANIKKYNSYISQAVSEELARKKASKK